MGHFRLFHKQITEIIVSIKVGDDWIRTADQITENIVSIKVADDWIRTVDPMVSEATTLPTKPQPLPLKSTIFIVLKYLKELKQTTRRPQMPIFNI